jgi:non-homologous end joining protein Ku
MLRAKQADLPAETAAAAPSPENVVNLMEALRRSLATEKPDDALLKPPPRRRARAPSKPTTRRTARPRKSG